MIGRKLFYVSFLISNSHTKTSNAKTPSQECDSTFWGEGVRIFHCNPKILLISAWVKVALFSSEPCCELVHKVPVLLILALDLLGLTSKTIFCGSKIKALKYHRVLFTSKSIKDHGIDKLIAAGQTMINWESRLKAKL